MNSWDLNKLLSKLLAVVVIGAPFAFLGGLVCYVLPKDQAPEEMADNVETTNTAESMDSIMSYDGVLDDELVALDTTSTGVGTITGGSGAAIHSDSIGFGISRGDSLPKFRSALTVVNGTKITTRNHNDFCKAFKGLGKDEIVTLDSVEQSKVLPVETKDIAPIDTLGEISALEV